MLMETSCCSVSGIIVLVNGMKETVLEDGLRIDGRHGRLEMTERVWGSSDRGTTADDIWSAAGEGETGLVVVGATISWVFERSIGVGVDVLAD